MMGATPQMTDSLLMIMPLAVTHHATVHSLVRSSFNTISTQREGSTPSSNALGRSIREKFESWQPFPYVVTSFTAAEHSQITLSGRKNKGV